MEHQPNPLSVISHITIHQCDPLTMGHNLGVELSNDIVGIAKGQSLLADVGSLGYTAAFLPNGDVEIGRPLSHCSPHCRGRNENGLGLVFVGSFERHQPSDAALSAGAEFVAHVCRELPLSVEWTEAHRDVQGGSSRKHNTCPGLQFSMSDFRKLILSKLAVMRAVGFDRLGVVV